MKRLGVFALLVLLGACASKTARKDPYAEAAVAKRTQLQALSEEISRLRARPDASLLTARIDSLESLRSVTQAGLGSIGMAVDESGKMSKDRKALHIFHDSLETKKYPNYKP